MIPFIPKKPFNVQIFESYLQESVKLNSIYK